MSKNLELSYSFGYVYDKSKLIVMCPIGENTMSEEEYEMEVEVAFLEDGIERAFEQNDIDEANEIIKPLETFLMKPNKIIPFVTSIKNAETKEEYNKMLEEFDEEYKVKESYKKKGYEIADIYEVFQNIVNYIPKESLDNLNILKVEADKINLKEFINNTRSNLDDAIESNMIPIIMRKSTLTNRLFVEDEKQVLNKDNINKDEILNVLDKNSLYVMFGIDTSEHSEGILCANKEKNRRLRL